MEIGVKNVLKEINNMEKNSFIGLIEYLNKRGYITTSPSENKTFKKIKYTEFPKIAYYEASEKCNLKCRFCYANPDIQHHCYIGNTFLTKKIITKLFELNVVYLIFSGGEPLLRKDLFEIIEYAKKKIKFVGMTTNGTLIGKEEAKKLKETGIDYIQISIESPEEKINDKLRGKGTFKKCLEAINHLKNANFRKEQLYITATITKINIDTLIKFSDFGKRLEVETGLSFFQPVGRAFNKNVFALLKKELIKFFFEKLKKQSKLYEPNPDCLNIPDQKVTSKIIPSLKNYCGMGFKTLGVKENGSVVPCHLFFSSNDFIIGNILDKDIVKKLILFLNSIPSIDEIHECKKCDIRYFCCNGCWANVYWHHKTFNGRNPYCEFFYDYFSSIIWNLGEEKETERIYLALSNLTNF
ncbi:radical SAM protein [Candidatus Aminicenantes bacterium AC-335-L06]|nr:radical SAM protein [Candidatus Aminicenantes bacterium AC-335-L06]